MGALLPRGVITGLVVAVLTVTIVAWRSADYVETRENDRIANVVAVALSSPRPTNAASLQRHIAALRAGADGRLEVLEAVDLAPDEMTDPLAQMVWRVTAEASGGLAGSTPKEVVACYEVRFNYYGAVGSPHRVHCPAGAPALEPPPPAGDHSIGTPVPRCYSGSGGCPGG